MAEASLLQARALAGVYGGKPILQGVDLAVGAGEILAVIGRNGVGKTTLMRALIGLLPLGGGTILCSGASGSRRSARTGAHAEASATCRKGATSSPA